ncbi:MAG: glycosyltransferase [Candidatus Paceibacterota bacterium]
MEISVIVPVYNAENTIEQCLKSLTNQTIRKNLYEIILIDDGSIDNTASVIKTYIAENSEVKISYLKIENSGPARARNIGVKKSDNKIVLLTDSDCKVEENWIEMMYSSFEENDVVAVKGRYKTQQTSEVAKLVQAEFETKYRVLAKYECIDFVDTYSAGYRRDIFLEIEGFDESYPQASTEDIDLSFRLYQKGYKMKFNSHAIVYHIHPDTYSSIFRKKVKFAYWRMYTNFKLGKFSDTRTDKATKLQLLNIPLMLLLLVTSVIFSEVYLHLILITALIFQSLMSLPLYRSYRVITSSNVIKSFLLYSIYVNVKSSGQLYGILKYLINPPKIKN